MNKKQTVVDQNFIECVSLHEVIPAPFGKTMSSRGYACKRSGGRCPLWADGTECKHFSNQLDRSEAILTRLLEDPHRDLEGEVYG